MTKLIPSLNGLRALSIFCVLTAHIQIINLKLPNGPGGQIGVNIFFVISGFLITLLLLKEEEKTGIISLNSFFIRRSLRIFPVFYLLLLVYAVLQAANILHIGLSSWLSSATYTKYFFAKGQNDWETGHMWSLSVEENFYLIWPLVFVYLKKLRVAFAIGIILVVPIVRLLTDVSVMHLFTRADALMLGCLFALFYPNILHFLRHKNSIALLIPFIGLAACLGCKKFLPVADPELKNHIALAFFGSFGMFTNACIGLIVIISINFRQNLYYQFLNTAAMDYIGRLSYSIYLWQQLFFSKNMGYLSNLPTNLGCIIAVSLASYYLVEQPFLRLKNRFSKKEVKLHQTV